MCEFFFKNERPYKLNGRRGLSVLSHFLAAEFSWKAMLGTHHSDSVYLKRFKNGATEEDSSDEVQELTNNSMAVIGNF